MRIALHNAHAKIVKDPFTDTINAYGPQVNMAARLEPVTLPNEVFATDEFKRALDTLDSRVYEWDDVGCTRRSNSRPWSGGMTRSRVAE